MLFANSNYCMADDAKEIEWVDNKATAFKLAKEQGKFIFLLVGIEGCSRCQNAIKLLNEEPFRSIAEDNYIMWINEYDNPDTYDEVGIYTYEYVQIGVTLPLLYIIDPDKPEKAVASKWMATVGEAPEEIEKLLNIHTTSNDVHYVHTPKAFISGNTLNISNDISDENIYVYSLDGKYVTSFHKKDNKSSIDTSGFPKGVLVIYSSKKWSLKITNN